MAWRRTTRQRGTCAYQLYKNEEQVLHQGPEEKSHEAKRVAPEHSRKERERRAVLHLHFLCMVASGM